ncbi:MAG: hypothetical protein PSV16_02035 [Flavobacterium sp.]|nr:hypothetical protein [Flavobacterium sp.]
MKKQLFYILLLLVGCNAFAQQITTKIDKTKNKIGAQFNLTLRTTVDTNTEVVFPRSTNFGGMEVIRDFVIDTIKKDDKYELIKKYGLAQFDSGKYSVPPLKILINKQPFYSDKLEVEVSNIKVDTLKQKMYDIKSIVEVEQPIGSWWIYLLILLAIIGIGFLVYKLIKRYQIKKLDAEIYKTPIEKATSLLKNLENKQLWQKGEIKSYYVELTDIARNYIEEEIQIPAMESTTTELITALRNVARRKNMKLSKETLINLEKVLKQADLVKFAKVQPLDFEIEEDKKRIVTSIVRIHEAVPEVVVDPGDSALDELLKQKLLKKKRQKRILLSIVAVVIAFLAAITILIAVKGLDYVKDNFLGHPTKELLEGEWVKSEYGNPPITIETPKVLKRTDLSKSIPEGAGAMIKGMQAFTYGSFLDNFSVTVSTLTYKQQMQIDLAKGMESGIHVFESKGAKNILSDQQEFETKDGVSGRKGFGTFSVIDPIQQKSIRMYFEILLFGQENGLQQIIIVHEEGDKYAEQISERVLKSVELKKSGE